MAKDEEPEATQPGQTDDPLTGKSMSGLLLIAMLLTFASLVWALYDELLSQRPWKRYQNEFVELYTSHLKSMGPRQAAAEKAVFTSAGFQDIEQELKSEEAKLAPRLTQIDQELRGIRQNLAAIKDPFQDARARIAALTYELDHIADAKGKDSKRREISDVKKGPFQVASLQGNGTPMRSGSVTYDDLEKSFNELKGREAQLVAEQTELTKGVRELRRKRSEHLGDHLVGLNQQQIDGLLRKMDTFAIEVKQIHVEEAGLVDRCESCHLGVREPVTLTAASMGGKQLFVSHPAKELLAIHDPNRFGCSPCHNGNGLATSSASKAHGQYKHWLWPLFSKQNVEAGCLQCHTNDRVLEHAPVLTRGRDLYQLKGCIGCHRYEGFDREVEALNEVRKEVQDLETRQKEARLAMDLEVKKGDEAESNEQARLHFAKAESLKVSISNMDARIGELDQSTKFLMRDQKKVGPTLKDIRLKLRKEWIPVWLKDPQAFRPGTKMPRFRLSDEEIQAISAFLWQSGLEGPKPATQPPGNPVQGKELFETRGCLGCHSIGEGDNRMGDEFAANLSRLGEKANYDYIARWIHNPRERTRPYCPTEKRDLGPEDYARHGQPYIFDLDHSKCPNDGRELQVQNMTVMPSLRLSWEETRDIASYLTSLKHSNASYPNDVSYMDNTALTGRGRQLVNRYGCANCHEIRGMEDAPRIGTELTKEASKPMEQLDFGLLEGKARREKWYSHKGFFEHKLENPAVFDQGRDKAPEDLLKMPEIQLTKEDIRALTTFLLGSMESPFHGGFRMIPAQFRYIPIGQKKDEEEGWWIVKKYNCMGCHTLQAGQKSVLSALPRYQDPDWKEQLPPTLIQEGARVNPDWLLRFLANPALNEKDVQRNGVRTYLKVRMPTFSFSPNEIRALVRFFEGSAGQPNPYIPTKLEPLTERERLMSRSLFSSQGAPCLKCHLIGEPSHDRFATAPNFLTAAGRLKPPWTTRWMLDPQAISPGTAMPSGLFRKEGERWVFAGQTPESFHGYNGDHAQLLVRYMFELTPEEQRRLTQMMPASAAPKSGRQALVVKSVLPR